MIAEALRRLGAEHALVVHGTIGMDEIAPTGSTAMWEVHGGQLRNYVIDPSSYDLRHDDIAALAGGEPAENAARVTRLLLDPGSDPAGRAAVALNAGAAVYVAGLGGSLQEGIEQALTALEEGRGASALERLKRESGVSTSE